MPGFNIFFQVQFYVGKIVFKPGPILYEIPELYDIANKDQCILACLSLKYDCNDFYKYNQCDEIVMNMMLGLDKKLAESMLNKDNKKLKPYQFKFLTNIFKHNTIQVI